MEKRLRICFAIIVAATLLLGEIGAVKVYQNREWGKRKEMVLSEVKVLKETGSLDTIIKTNYQIDSNLFFLMIIDLQGNVLYSNDSDRTGKIDLQNECPDVWNAYQTNYGGASEENRNGRLILWMTERNDDIFIRVGIKKTSIRDILPEILTTLLVNEWFLWLLITAISFGIVAWVVKPFKNMAQDIGSCEIDYSPYPEIQPYIQLIQKQKEDLRKNADIKEVFFSNITHEFKTPLASIMGSAQVLESGKCNEVEQTRFAREILFSSKRLNELVQNALCLSELDLKEATLMKKERISLYDLTEMCVASLKEQALQKELTMEFSGDHYEINADPILIETLVYNLVSNAIRYNRPGGSIKVSVSNKLSVSDTGIGMTKEQREHIFERFYRADKEESRRKGGNGLGLAIVKEIAELHNAQIDVISQEGVGTTFIVSFSDAKPLEN